MKNLPSTDGQPDPFRVNVILGLAIATSVDAFAAGITLPLLRAPLTLSLACIGITTAVLSAAGLALGPMTPRYNVLHAVVDKRSTHCILC
jgi:manganese efflux pump family protein